MKSPVAPKRPSRLGTGESKSEGEGIGKSEGESTLSAVSTGPLVQTR